MKATKEFQTILDNDDENQSENENNNENNSRQNTAIVERVFTDDGNKKEDNNSPNTDLNVCNEIKTMQRKIKDLQYKSEYLQAVNSVYLDMLKGKKLDNFKNFFSRQKLKKKAPEFLNPLSSRYEQPLPYQPYLFINPQTPQILPKINNLIPLQYQPNKKIHKRNKVYRSRSQDEYFSNRHSDEFLEKTKHSLHLFVQGLREYFCKQAIYIFISIFI